MNGRPPAFRVSGHPVAQFLSMMVLGVVVVGALIVGAFAFLALLAVFAVGFAIFRARAWWRWRRLRGVAAFDRGVESGRDERARYIEGEFEVVEVRADPPRRNPGAR